MSERKYLPTFPELVDRLSIVMLKQIRIPENREAYQHEIRLIEHDLDLFGQNGRAIYLILLIGLANETIWQNESKARAGGSEQDKNAAQFDWTGTARKTVDELQVAIDRSRCTARKTFLLRRH